MEINLSIRYVAWDESTSKAVVLCFRHAAKAAVLHDVKIEPEVDDFNQEGDCRSTICEVCDTWEPRDFEHLVKVCEK